MPTIHAYAATRRMSPPEEVSLVVCQPPLLPGGANGGAKWFVLALLGEISRQRTGWRWLLLATAANDASLGELFPSMARLQAIDGAGHVIVRPAPAALPGGRADLRRSAPSLAYGVAAVIAGRGRASRAKGLVGHEES